MQVSWGFPPILKDPFNTCAGAGFEAGTGAEVIAELHLTADIQIGNAEVLSDIVPELGFRDEDKRTIFPSGDTKLVNTNNYAVAFKPEIGKTAETETGYAEEVLHTPYESELEGYQTHAGIATHIIAKIVNVLTQKFEVKRVLEVAAV